MGALVGGISSAARGVPVLDGQSFAVSRAAGPYLWGTDGVRYIDTALGFGANFLGHAPSGVLAAVSGAMAGGTMPAFPHPLESEAADALAARTAPLDRIVFVNTGSEAVHLACRIARAATGRGTIAKMAGGYDGWLDPVLFGTAGSAEARMADNSRPARPGTVLLRYNDRADTELLFAENGDIAAIIIEPVLANAGCIVPLPGYLEHLVGTARANGALVITDEVLMGFRLRAGLAAHALGLEADLAALGKAIGSGFPVAAVAGRGKVMAVLEDGRVGRAGTYNGNVVAAAAVKATMEALGAVDYAAIERRGADIRGAITAAFAGLGRSIATSGYGAVFSLWPGLAPPESYAEALARDGDGFTLAMHLALRREGVMSMASPMGRHFLSAAHDDAVCAELVDAFRRAARQVLA